MTMRERYLALTEKRKIPEVIVVEGKDDTANLKRYYKVDTDRKSTRLNSSHITRSRMPSSA